MTILFHVKLVVKRRCTCKTVVKAEVQTILASQVLGLVPFGPDLCVLYVLCMGSTWDVLYCILQSLHNGSYMVCYWTNNILLSGFQAFYSIAVV